MKPASGISCITPGFEAFDVVDDEKRLPKTEVLAGYSKKVDDLTADELAKRKEIIEKTRWFPNYRADMFAPGGGQLRRRCCRTTRPIRR